MADKPRVTKPCLACGERAIIGVGFTGPCNATSMGQHIFTEREARGERKVPRSIRAD